MRPAGSAHARSATGSEPLGSPWLRVAISAVGLLLVAGALAAGFLSRGRVPEDFIRPDRERSLARFRLTDRTGRTVTEAELRNRFAIVSFVFTSCGTTCLRVSRQMAALQHQLAASNDVQLVSLTVDPRTDTPDVLNRFAAKFGADTNRWLFLTGPKDAVLPLIETSFLVRETIPGEAAMPGDFAHMERLAVVDRRGDVRAYFDGLNTNTPAAVLAFLDRLRKEELR